MFCYQQRKVSSGIAAVAMIINGLGFTNRRLYLTHQFFETKPIERLLSPEFEAKDITEYIVVLIQTANLMGFKSTT
ncbi:MULTISPECIES: DUF4277 domain-containing protein [Candidatus Rhabdochlamydia]|uniref:DUF4277 domain-containing protein n=1 Tax=Candidatus Rhabdochlamydia TaxID=292833 RepID=UPI002110F1F4|nr:DUF4277 domain-containing protein [Candidatus Rhabdochlamydia sp. W815]